jgi:predicted DNA-binding helix-hairpin-helix protein
MCKFWGVNINTASKHLLSYVSGIGEKLAENIVNYRSENGPLRISNSKKYLVWAKSLSARCFLFELKTGKTHWITQPFILKPIQLWKNGQRFEVESN